MNVIFISFISLFFVSCFRPADESDSRGPSAKPTINKFSVSNSNELKIEGQRLNKVVKVSLIDSEGNLIPITMNEKKKLSIRGGIESGIKLAAGKVYKAVVETAYAQSTTSLSFEIQDNSITGIKLQDQTIGANKLSDMGATSGQILRYNGSNWIPSDLSGLNYVGSWDASSGANPSVSPLQGEYWIVSVAGTHDMGDGNGAQFFSVGDWVVYNSVSGVWDKINNANGDNFGNHTASQKISLNGNYLSNDMTAAEGLSFDSDGQAMISHRHSSNTGIVESLVVRRINHTGSGGNGIGTSIALELEATNSSYVHSASVKAEATDANAASFSSKMILGVTNSGAPFDAVTILPNGNLGIGQATPGQKLEVNGSGLATSWLTTSDRRFKRDIQSIPSALESLNKIEGVSYYWDQSVSKKKSFDNSLQFGFVAQELEEVYPNLVYTDAKGYKSVNYTGMIAVLVQATNEILLLMAEENRELESKLSQRDAKFELLAGEVEKLRIENGELRSSLNLLDDRMKRLERVGK
jgi:hypothetical protein